MEMSFHVSVSPGAVKRKKKKPQREMHKVLVMTAGAPSGGADPAHAISPTRPHLCWLSSLKVHIHQARCDSVELHGSCISSQGETVIGRDLPSSA